MEVNIIILLGVGLTLLSALVLLRLRHKKRLGKNLEAWGRKDVLARIELLRRQSPAATDQKAYDRIASEVKVVSHGFSMSTSVAPQEVYEMAAELTRNIAGIYYPNVDNPVLQASFADLLKLNERVVTRLNLKIQEFPFNTVKDINIHKILKGKDYYDSKIKNKIEWLKKYETLYKIGSHAWLGYNALNPWYWGRKIAYTSTREITFRYLLTWIITIVGEEAMAVYSRRDIYTREIAYERDLAFAMVDMARANKDMSPKTYELVLDHLLNKARLNDTLRVNILRALMAKRQGDAFFPTGNYTEKQIKRFLKSVKRLATVDGEMSAERQEKIFDFERAMATGSDNERSSQKPKETDKSAKK